MEDEPAAPSTRAPTAAASEPSWAKQMEKTYAASQKQQAPSARSKPSSSSPANDRNTMVNIVGYDGNQANASSSGRSSRQAGDDYAYGSLGYGSIAGVAGVADNSKAGSHASSVVRVDYPLVPSAGAHAFAVGPGRISQPGTRELVWRLPAPVA